MSLYKVFSSENISNVTFAVCSDDVSWCFCYNIANLIYVHIFNFL